jgi:hypothetical protein
MGVTTAKRVIQEKEKPGHRDGRGGPATGHLRPRQSHHHVNDGGDLLSAPSTVERWAIAQPRPTADSERIHLQGVLS